MPARMRCWNACTRVVGPFWLSRLAAHHAQRHFPALIAKQRQSSGLTVSETNPSVSGAIPLECQRPSIRSGALVSSADHAKEAYLGYVSRVVHFSYVALRKHRRESPCKRSADAASAAARTSARICSYELVRPTSFAGVAQYLLLRVFGVIDRATICWVLC